MIFPAWSTPKLESLAQNKSLGQSHGILDEHIIANAPIELRTSSTLLHCSRVTDNREAMIRIDPYAAVFPNPLANVSAEPWASTLHLGIQSKCAAYRYCYCAVFGRFQELHAARSSPKNDNKCAVRSQTRNFKAPAPWGTIPYRRFSVGCGYYPVPLQCRLVDRLC